MKPGMLTKGDSVRSLLVVIALLPTFGCRRQISDDSPTPTPDAERFAAKVCSSAAACNCATRFESEDQCVESFSERFTTVQQRLMPDAECFEAYMEDEEIGACAEAEDLVPTLGCTALRGTKREGEPCSPHSELLAPLPFVNECEDGLQCLVGSCVANNPIIPQRQAGEPCNSSVPGSCDALNGIFCGSDGLCHASAAEGESCTSPFDCREPGKLLYCRFGGDPVGSCVTRVEVGGACDPTDHSPCRGVAMDAGAGEVTVGPAWCDGSTRTCAEGHGPAVCTSVGHPFVWPNG